MQDAGAIRPFLAYAEKYDKAGVQAIVGKLLEEDSEFSKRLGMQNAWQLRLFLLYAEKHAPEQVEAIRTRLQSRRT